MYDALHVTLRTLYVRQLTYVVITRVVYTLYLVRHNWVFHNALSRVTDINANIINYYNNTLRSVHLLPHLHNIIYIILYHCLHTTYRQW
jgi:hypothetical protein